MKKLKEVKGIGPKTLINLYENKIYNPYSLILTFPKKYDFFSSLSSIKKENHNEEITIKGTISNITKNNTYSKVKYSKFLLEIDNVRYDCIAFNQPFLADNLKEQEQYVISGKINFYKKEIVVKKVFDQNFNNLIEPKYNLNNIYDKTFNKIVFNILDKNEVNIYETLPTNYIKKYKLLDRKNAINHLHFPKNDNDIKEAYKRFKYEEAYNFLNDLKNKVNIKIKRESIDYDLTKVKTLISKIPYELTNDQKNAVNDCFKDFKTNHLTYRLIQGDVGSGKTIVSLIAAYGVITNNKQVAIMAPTEILARQHYDFFKQYIDDYNIELLTSSVKNKKEIYGNVKNGKTSIIIGTHALANEDLIFKNLNLVIIDEQHKFGVNIRNELVKKGDANLIYLTATPIPRTLAISLYGRANISVIKEKPKERIKVNTKYISDTDLSEIINQINLTISKGEKTFIVVPAVTSTHAKYNVSNVYDWVVKNINFENIYFLHGSLKKDEQELAINNFINNKSSILISTSMVEVGIDVSDATLMIIFSADFFGLSQLHQLRGRVGRSNLESTCYLISTTDDKERLKIIEKENDGFKLSEYDLKTRGPGIFFGTDQTGDINFKFLDLKEDIKILEEIRSGFFKM